ILSWRRGETEYWLSWLPLGGYVKMAGLEDEGVAGGVEGGKSAIPIDPARAFDRQPVWKRTIVILAGVTMNAVFAFLIYAGLATRQALAQALTRLDPPRIGLLEPGRPAIRAGLRPGDLLVRADGDTVRSWSGVLRTVWNSPEKPVRFDVLRDGQIVQVTVVPERKVETDSASPRPHVYGAIGAAPNPPT